MNPYVEANSVYRGHAYMCTVQRLGHRCGYVQINPGEKFYGVGYEEIGIECHGGLTYSGRSPTCESRSEAANGLSWWIGFDCAHSMDSPDYAAARRYYAGNKEIIAALDISEQIDSKYRIRGEVRTEEYVVQECKKIIDQLIDIENNSAREGKA